MSAAIPVIDIGSLLTPSRTNHASVYEEIRKASIEWGAFYIINHNLVGEIEPLKDSMQRIFNYEDKEDDEYKAFRTALQVTTNEIVSTDSQEALYYGKYKEPYLSENQLVSNFTKPWSSFLKTAETTVDSLLNAYGSLLGLSDGCLPYDHETEDLSLMCYHRTEEEGIDELRPHTDWGWFSLLVADEPGLQGMSRDGNWYEINPIKDAIVVLVSDSLELITNGLFRSFPHRVKIPKGLRYSAACFIYPPIEYKLDVMKIPDAAKIKESSNDKRWPLEYKTTLPTTFKDYFFKSMNDLFQEGQWKDFRLRNYAN